MLSLFRSCLGHIGEVSWVKIHYASIYFIVKWIVCMCLCQGIFSRIGWIHIERQLHYHQACFKSVSTFVTLTKERQYCMRSPVREVSKSKSLKIFLDLKENHYHVPSLNLFLVIYFRRSLYWNRYILAGQLDCCIFLISNHLSFIFKGVSILAVNILHVKWILEVNWC